MRRRENETRKDSLERKLKTETFEKDYKDIAMFSVDWVKGENDAKVS